MENGNELGKKTFADNRQRIAEKAMQSLIVVSEYTDDERHLETPSLMIYENIAKHSVMFADALLNELSKQK